MQFSHVICTTSVKFLLAALLSCDDTTAEVEVKFGLLFGLLFFLFSSPNFFSSAICFVFLSYFFFNSSFCCNIPLGLEITRISWMFYSMCIDVFSTPVSKISVKSLICGVGSVNCWRLFSKKVGFTGVEGLVAALVFVREGIISSSSCSTSKFFS